MKWSATNLACMKNLLRCLAFASCKTAPSFNNLAYANWLSGDWWFYSTNGMRTSIFVPTLDAYDQYKDHCWYQIESSWSKVYRCVYQNKLSCFVCQIKQHHEWKVLQTGLSWEPETDSERLTDNSPISNVLGYNCRQCGIRRLLQIHALQRPSERVLASWTNCSIHSYPF